MMISVFVRLCARVNCIHAWIQVFLFVKRAGALFSTTAYAFFLLTEQVCNSSMASTEEAMMAGVAASSRNNCQNQCGIHDNSADAQVFKHKARRWCAGVLVQQTPTCPVQSGVQPSGNIAECFGTSDSDVRGLIDNQNVVMRKLLPLWADAFASGMKAAEFTSYQGFLLRCVRAQSTSWHHVVVCDFVSCASAANVFAAHMLASRPSPSAGWHILFSSVRENICERSSKNIALFDIHAGTAFVALASLFLLGAQPNIHSAF